MVIKIIIIIPLQQPYIIITIIVAVPGYIHVVIHAADAGNVPGMRSPVAGSADNPAVNPCLQKHPVQQYRIALAY